jgi:hypothetical protein
MRSASGESSSFVEVSGLVNGGIEIPGLGRRAAEMAAQILKGVKLDEIPIVLPTKNTDAHQPRDGEGARPHCATLVARSRRKASAGASSSMARFLKLQTMPVR